MAKEIDKKLKAGIVIACFLLIIVIILACLYGQDLNCYNFQAEKDAENAAAKKGGPPMVYFPNIKANTELTKLNDTNAKAYMKTIGFSLVEGKEMHATVMLLESGPALMYTHWYESILFVMDGSFRISNGTGNSFTVTQQQTLFIPRGSVISYVSNSASSYMYIVSQPPTLERATAIQAAIGKNPTSLGYPSLVALPAAMTLQSDLQYFGGDNGDKSYLNDTLFSTVQGAGMTGGLYKLLKGPHLDYTYPYTEFKYIVNGEFHLTDGTGQKVVAKAGDLMYFPIGCAVRFESPGLALGFFVGQRNVGEA